MRRLSFAFALMTMSILYPAGSHADNAPAKTAVFAGGCFWSTQHAFENTDGVIDTKAGFEGGTAPNPSYERVTHGDTGYREAVEVTYDPSKVSYERLLSIYWRNTDPFDAEGQFCDQGDNYRPAVFVSEANERTAAESSKAALQKQFGKSVATEILPASPFYAAEEYHQHYADKNPIPYGLYRTGCGRDRSLKKIWGNEAGGDAFRHEGKKSP
jgi:peptide-methionine (S)-S-oxide reductase